MAPKKRSRDVQTAGASQGPKAKRARGDDAAARDVSAGAEHHVALLGLNTSPKSSARRNREDVESDAGSSSSTKAARGRGSRSPSAAEGGAQPDSYDDVFSQALALEESMESEFTALEAKRADYKLQIKTLDDLRKAYVEARQRAEETIAARQPIPHCDAMALNVGGQRFVVPVKTLLGRDEGSYFHALMRSRESEVPVFLDDNEDVFIDRDSETFRLVLRYLNGSEHFDMLDEEQLAKLKIDAQFFQLDGLLGLLAEPPKEVDQLLLPGPGVSIDRNRLRVMYCVGIIGDTQLVTGRHRITFEIMAAEYAGVGLVSEACITQDQEFHKTTNCCVYYMSGVFYANFPHHRKEETLEKFENGDFVSILVDLDKGFAEFTLKNTTKVVSIGRARRLRFAATLKLGSRVRIVPEAEVAERALRQRNAAAVTPSFPDLQMLSAARLEQMQSAPPSS